MCNMLQRRIYIGLCVASYVVGILAGPLDNEKYAKKGFISLKTNSYKTEDEPSSLPQKYVPFGLSPIEPPTRAGESEYKPPLEATTKSTTTARTKPPTKTATTITTTTTTPEATTTPPESYCAGEDYFLCSDNACIPKSFVCDGEIECANDEANCTTPINTCSTLFFRCDDGRCIWLSWVCDEEFDCSGGEDENNCISDTTSNLPEDLNPLESRMASSDDKINFGNICTPKSFHCADNSSCISRYWVCDTDSDCPDGSDELNCQKTTCGPGKLRCNDGSCLWDLWMCDGDRDCPQGEDEENCASASNAPDENFSPTISDRELSTIYSDIATLVPSSPACDMAHCLSCFPPDTGDSSSLCPRDFVDFEGYCLWINPYPMKWLRARVSCIEKNANLAQFANDDQFRGRLLAFLSKRSLHGLNYWIELPIGVGAYQLPEKEMQIPKWILNGRTTNERKYPPYLSDCYFLDYYDFKFYRSADCSDYAGSICMWNES